MNPRNRGALPGAQPMRASSIKLAPELVAIVKGWVADRGYQFAARQLGCNDSTVDKIVGSGLLKTETAARIAAAIAGKVAT